MKLAQCGDVYSVIGDTRELTGSVQADYDRAKADLIAQRSVFADDRLNPPSMMQLVQKLLEPPTELLNVFTATPDPEDSPPFEIPEGTGLLTDLANLSVKIAHDYKVAMTTTLPKRLKKIAEDKVKKAELMVKKASDFGLESSIDKILGGDENAILIPSDARDLDTEIDLEEYKNNLISKRDSLGKNTLDTLSDIPIG